MDSPILWPVRIGSRTSEMLCFSEIIFCCVLALVSRSMFNVNVGAHGSDKDSDYEVTSNSCWNTNECLIAANLQFLSGNILPITVNCSTAEKIVDETANNVLKRRYENISTVTLDGCGAALNANTFGFEYIPNCGKITTLNLKNFHFDEIYEIICGSGTVLQNVLFEHNEFARISDTSIANLKGVEILHFYNNNLRHIDGEAFRGLQRLKEIRLIEEMNLRIRYATMFKDLLRLEKLYVSSVDRVTSDLLLNLPVNLDELSIDGTTFEGEKFIVNAPPTLKNLTITNCGLMSATIKGHEMLVWLNLSANFLKDFSLENCTHLQVLDLSTNNLTHLPHPQFAQLHHLECVYLQKNKLKIISMSIFESSLAHIHTIDLRGNDLRHIDDITDTLVLSAHLRILIDGNPWNCIWLVNVSYRLPEQYRIFRYEKFISKINVNGLECMTYPADSSPDYLISGKKNATPAFTIVYGGPRESKRNQKAEALVIVFMLPLGIALLFVLLYLWINCQKVFHWSYYRNLPLMRGSAERFDIVRQLPHNNTAVTLNQGYEIPLTGCNCTDHSNKICSKLNLTYEEMPHQNAAKIYEEIIDYTNNTGNCYYDHLKYVDPNPDPSDIHA